MGVTHPGTAAGTLDSTGAGIVRIAPPPTGIVWRIHQMAISTVPAGLLYIACTLSGLPCMTPVLVFSGAAADGEPPIDIGSHDGMEINISNGTPNAAVTVAYYYEEIG